LLLAPSIRNAFDVAERFVNDRQPMLLQPLLVSKLSFALLAYSSEESEERDLKFDAEFVNFVCQVLEESLLVNKVPVTIATAELHCMNR